MNLSKNLTLEEVMVTQTGLDNTPGIDHESRLIYCAQYLFQPTRDRWGKIRITSGYRSPAVNKAVGGSKTSQHCRGEALDIQPLETDIVVVFDWMIAALSFGQAILEEVGDRRWIHISLPRPNSENQVCLKYNGVKYKPYLLGE